MEKDEREREREREYLEKITKEYWLDQNKVKKNATRK